MAMREEFAMGRSAKNEQSAAKEII